MILHRVPLGSESEGPESIQVDLVAEPGRHGVHQKTRRRPLNLDLVCQPVPAKEGAEQLIKRVRTASCEGII